MAIPEGETEFMVVNREAQISFRFEDRRGDPEAGKRLQAYLETDREEGFSLSRAPLLRLAVFQAEDKTWEIVVNNHHLILDGWSTAKVMTEVLKTYHGEALDPVLPFADYAEWLQSRGSETTLAWWRDTLAGFDKPNRIDIASAKDKTGFGEQVHILEAEDCRQIDRLARRLRSTRSTLLQAVWGALISTLDRRPGTWSSATSSPAAPRKYRGSKNMVGMFINTVPLRLQTSEQTFETLVEKLTSLQGEREQHEYTPLYLIQAEAPIQRGTSLFETLFVYENYPVDDRLEGEAGQDFTITESRGIEAPHYPLTLAVLPGEHLNLRLTHDLGYYGDLAAGAYSGLVRGVAAFPPCRNRPVLSTACLSSGKSNLNGLSTGSTKPKFPTRPTGPWPRSSLNRSGRRPPALPCGMPKKLSATPSSTPAPTASPRP